MRSYLFAFAIFSLVVPYCLADIVPISISEQVQGSGSTFICLLFECSVANSFTFDVTNTTPGLFDISKSGQEVFGSCCINISVASSSAQTSDVTAKHISVGMHVSSEVSGFEDHAGSHGDSSSQFLMQFDLTSPTSVHLMGSVGEVTATNSSSGFATGGLADAHLLLSGPGFQFASDESCSTLLLCLDVGAIPFDEQFLLGPGIYQFSASTDASAQAGSAFFGTVGADANLSVNADFAPVPEPGYMALVVVALFFASIVILSTRRSLGNLSAK